MEFGFGVEREDRTARTTFKKKKQQLVRSFKYVVYLNTLALVKSAYNVLKKTQKKQAILYSAACFADVQFLEIVTKRNILKFS